MGRASWFLGIVAALFGVGNVARAAPARPPSVQPIHACFARDTGQTPAQMLAPTARFDCTTPEFAFGPGDYWARADGLPPRAGASLLRTRWQWQDHAQLFVAFRDGSLVALPVQTASGDPEWGDVPDHVVLPRDGHGVSALLWRIGGSVNIRRILAETYLVSPLQETRYEVRAAAMLAGFMGLGIALLAYNLALWVALRRRFQLAYCGLAASLLAYALLAAELLPPLLPGIDRNTWIAAAYGMLSLSFCAALWFTRAFFGHRLPLRVHRLCGLLCAGLAGGTFVTFLVPPGWLRIVDVVQGALGLALLGVVGPLLVHGWRQGRGFFTVVALIWAGPAVLAGMRVVNTFHLLPFLLAVREWTIILLAAQALAGSLAVAWRIHLLARERDEARAQEAAARLLADTDPLTGLLNRRALLARAIGRGRDQLLLLADLDHFKAINETIGHDGGDEVLRGFARALSEALPEGALAARIGGEEFAVIAAADGSVTPRLVDDALRRVRAPFDLPVTTSIGTCVGPLACDADWKALYRCADRALFAAKAAGRDRARDAAALDGGSAGGGAALAA